MSGHRTARSTIVYPATRGGSLELGYTMVDQCVSRARKGASSVGIHNGRPCVRSGTRGRLAHGGCGYFRAARFEADFLAADARAAAFLAGFFAVGFFAAGLFAAECFASFVVEMP